MNKKRILIVGGVAGGASCAARARRLSESSQIIVFDRGAFVSFANCGLPYYVGNVIKKKDDLIVATPEKFKQWFNIDVRTRSYVRSIFPDRKCIAVENLDSGQVYEENYDALVLSPGSAPLRPPIDGIDLPGIFTLRTIPDSEQIKAWLDRKKVEHVAIAGGGFIGLEMAENLKRRGLLVTLIEMQPHVMPSMDFEMASFIHDHLRSQKVSLCLGSLVTAFSPGKDGAIAIGLASGRTINADMVLLAMGVRPETEPARDAGLQIGATGGIFVDEYMRTSNAHIFAVGDAVEVKNYITQTPTLVPLAGPANRQGRLAADVIMGQPDLRPFRGVQATAVCGVLGLTIAATGLTEKALQQINGSASAIAYDKIYLMPGHHASYYPGAKTIFMKLIFTIPDGKILGAQAVGPAGVAKRIDVIAMAIQNQATVFDLAEAELCYAPQYGSAKDPINLAGMIAANVLQGLSPNAHWESAAESQPFILDVREPAEFKKGNADSALHIPLGQLREKLDVLPRDREIWVYCYSGQRSYYAVRILRRRGFKARNISGGFGMYSAVL